jgi:hypothetical protein
MKKHKRIYMYSAFPILDIGGYFSKQAIKPISFEQKLDKLTFLPTRSGFSKSYLLKIEHELTLKSEVHIFSSFLNETDYSPIYSIAKKYNAEIDFIYIETSMEQLYGAYKNKKGKLPFENFCDTYEKFFTFPYKGIKKIIFERLT